MDPTYIEMPTMGALTDVAQSTCQQIHADAITIPTTVEAVIRVVLGGVISSITNAITTITTTVEAVIKIALCMLMAITLLFLMECVIISSEHGGIIG